MLSFGAFCAAVAEGYYYARSWSPCVNFAVLYGGGDAVTVRLDVEANVISFLKNGAAVGPAQPIEGASDGFEGYNFVFNAHDVGGAVTIVAFS